MRTGNRVKRLTDAEDVRYIFAHDSVYPYISDDYSEPADLYDPSDVIQTPGAYFIGGYVDNNLAGCFFYHVHNAIMYEVHSAVLPDWRGVESIRLARLSLDWMFNNTPCLKVITYVPENNKSALSLAKKVGMLQEGVHRESFMKNGKLLDQHVLGITKGEFTCQQQP